MDSLGAMIKRHRQHKGLTLVQLGEKVSLTHGYLSNIENNNKIPTPEVLKKIAEVLDCSYSELLILAGHIGEGEIQELITRMANIKNIFGEAAEGIKDTLETVNLKSILIQESELRYDMHNLTDNDRQAIITFIEEILLKIGSEEQTVNKFEFNQKNIKKE